MLVTLEGYENYDLDELEGFSLKKKFRKARKKLKKKSKRKFSKLKIAKSKLKRSTKKAAKVTRKVTRKAASVGKKAVSKTVQLTQSPIGMTALNAAALAMGIPGGGAIVGNAMGLATGLITGSPEAVKGIAGLAANQALNYAGLSSLTSLPTDQKLLAIENSPENVKQIFNNSYTNLQNEGIKKLTNSLVKEEKQTMEKEPEVKKFTLEEIEAFNKQQRYSSGGVLDFAPTDSEGDKYYKEGKLMGETDQNILKTLATKIYSQNPYSTVDLISWEYVERILKAYVYAVTKLSEENKKSYYYNGTTEAERQQVFGNLYVKICYLYLKGFSTEAEAKQGKVDYTLRDQIWIVLALLKKFAREDKTNSFIKFWKPYEYNPQISAGKINPLMIAGAGGLLFLMLGKKK